MKITVKVRVLIDVLALVSVAWCRCVNEMFGESRKDILVRNFFETTGINCDAQRTRSKLRLCARYYRQLVQILIKLLLSINIMRYVVVGAFIQHQRIIQACGPDGSRGPCVVGRSVFPPRLSLQISLQRKVVSKNKQASASKKWILRTPCAVY